MQPVPDSWPPSAPRTSVAPLFPLPGAFLYPRTVLPLRIFEPRYVQMLEDVLDGPGRIVIGTVLQPDVSRIFDENNPPSVLSIAGMGEIARHEKLSDDEYLVLLYGQSRVAIDEAPCDRLYRKVTCTPLAEIEATQDEVSRLDGPLRKAVLERTTELANLPDDVPIEILSDLLCQRIAAPQSVLEEIFAEPDVACRGQLTLAAHHRYPDRPEDRSGSPTQIDPGT